MTENIEITDEELAAFVGNEGLEDGEAPPYHPILRVWREVLSPAREELDAKVTPQWASRIVTTHTGLTFGDMEKFRDSYFGKIVELLEILELEIESDDECLSYATPEEDVEHNGDHYRNLLLTWQMAFLQWELDWETTAPDAAVELAAISEVHKMFFGQTGVTAFLDNIKFEFTEADQQLVAEALEELKEGR